MVKRKYTEDEHEFLRAFIPGHTYKEIVAAFNERFALPITEGRVKSYMGNHRLKNGLDGRFKKGQMPHNTKPIGYERVSKDGYIEVKVRMRSESGKKNFVAKHILVWEAANGPVPKGCVVNFLDGDKTNCDLDNLVLLTRREHLQMTREKLRYKNREVTKVGVEIAKLAIATNEAKKRGKK